MNLHLYILSLKEIITPIQIFKLENKFLKGHILYCSTNWLIQILPACFFFFFSFWLLVFVLAFGLSYPKLHISKIGLEGVSSPWNHADLSKRVFLATWKQFKGSQPILSTLNCGDTRVSSSEIMSFTKTEWWWWVGGGSLSFSCRLRKCLAPYIHRNLRWSLRP